MIKKRPIALLSVGELLIDLMSNEFAESLADSPTFQRFPGGSPANLCMNMARLGNSTKLIATLGQDDMGDFLLKYVQALPINCEHIQQVATPTTLILVTRSKDVANFEAYRGADYQIIPQQITEETLQKVSIFHTTCFALSKNPAQATILASAKKAVQLGCALSIDANYAQKIWPNRMEAQQIVAQYCSFGAIIKISEVDWERLYEKPLTSPKTAIAHFLNLGAKEVCLTLGAAGCWVGNAAIVDFIPARKVIVKDTTGAGDAFWSGYLTAALEGHSIVNRAKAGRKMAEIKIGHLGALPSTISQASIYEDL